VAGILLTMDGDQGVKCLQIVRPGTAVSVHFNDYTVFESPWDDLSSYGRQGGAQFGA
jgi:hypothetical protein